MKDLVSKITFGFVMAQLFPGSVAVLSISLLNLALSTPELVSMVMAIRGIVASWSILTISGALFLLGMCMGAGMLIHGLHWAVMGQLERDFGSVFDSYWHKKRLVWQVLLGPVKIVREIVALFLLAKGIRSATVKENVVRLDKDKMPQFLFLQDFYLYPAQFFAHTAYALLLFTVSAITFCIRHDWTLRRALFASCAYCCAGVFFVLGRLQLQSLFSAEEELVKQEQPESEPTTPRR